MTWRATFAGPYYPAGAAAGHAGLRERPGHRDRVLAAGALPGGRGGLAHGAAHGGHARWGLQVDLNPVLTLG
jgi:hypothetical protein